MFFQLLLAYLKSEIREETEGNLVRKPALGRRGAPDWKSTVTQGAPGEGVGYRDTTAEVC